jgi:hypothetical protein
MEPARRLKMVLVLAILAGAGGAACSGGGAPASQTDAGGGGDGRADGGDDGLGGGGSNGATGADAAADDLAGGPDGGGDAGETGGDGATSGVPGSKRLDELTLDEKKQLCDFESQHFGGYGMVIDCGGGNRLYADISQDTCVGNFKASCPVTVSEAEACNDGMTCATPTPVACFSQSSCF